MLGGLRGLRIVCLRRKWCQLRVTAAHGVLGLAKMNLNHNAGAFAPIDFDRGKYLGPAAVA